MVFGIGDRSGDGEGGGVGGGGWVGIAAASWMALEIQRGDIQCVKCLLLWQISILGGVFEQERVGKKNTGKGGGGVGERVFYEV